MLNRLFKLLLNFSSIILLFFWLIVGINRTCEEDIYFEFSKEKYLNYFEDCISTIITISLIIFSLKIYSIAREQIKIPITGIVFLIIAFNLTFLIVYGISSLKFCGWHHEETVSHDPKNNKTIIIQHE